MYAHSALIAIVSTKAVYLLVSHGQTTILNPHVKETKQSDQWPRENTYLIVN